MTASNAEGVGTCSNQSGPAENPRCRFDPARIAARGASCRCGDRGDKIGEDRIMGMMSDTPEDAAWRGQCRYQLDRDVVTRIKYGFCHVHKPVLDDAPVRAFATMAEYRRWCDLALPAYLGYRLASRDR